MKKRLGIKRSSYEILQILSVSLFDKTPMVELISEFNLLEIETPIQNRKHVVGFLTGQAWVMSPFFRRATKSAAGLEEDGSVIRIQYPAD